MANAEKLITLILLLVLLHLFRPGKKHVFLLGPFYIVSFLKKKINVIKKGKLLGTASYPDVLRVLSRAPSPHTLGRIT